MQKVIDMAIANRPLIGVVFLAVLLAGALSYRTLAVDAYPDISPALVQVFVETEGLAPEEVEKYVTYPLETSMSGLPELESVRSVSNFGLSVLNLYFAEGTDIYFARQLVSERLQSAREAIAEGYGEPVMGPVSTGLGQVLFYVLEDTTGQYTTTQLRTWQDWLVKRNLETLKGVAEVLSIGGHVKQYQVLIDPLALERYDVSLPLLKQVIENNSANAGAQYIVRNGEEYAIRSVGLATDAEAIKRVVIKHEGGTPVYLEQLGRVEIGGAIRRGVTSKNGAGEVVVGMVLKLIGANTSDVIQRVKSELASLNQRLPEGLEVRPYYDQAQLVSAALATVSSALLQGVALVTLVLFVFMGGYRASSVVALSIPFSVAFALVAMNFFGITANLMSLGGLAIAIGLMVDGAVVVVENIDRRLRVDPEPPKLALIAQAAAEVARPIVFAIAIIILVFLPLFSLQGVEGTTFRPLAQTVALAMLGSLFYALLVAPVLASVLMRAKRIAGRAKAGESSEPSWLMRGFLRVYTPLLNRALKHWRLVGLAAVLLLALGAIIAPRLGSEFVPRLNEGDLLIRATMAPTISLDGAQQLIGEFERQLLREFEEVEQVVSRIGRGEVGAHADPVNNAEIFVALKPQAQWRVASSLDGLYRTMSERFADFPGVKFTFTQPIAAAVDELLTGTKAELALKLYGDDLTYLADKAAELETVLRQVPGASDVQRDQLSGSGQLQITLKRDAIARYGFNVSEVQRALQIGVGGARAGEVFEGVQRFDIYLRLQEPYRHSAEAIAALRLTSPGGVKVTLEQLAQIEEVTGPRQITRENNQRFVTVQANVRDRDIGSFVAEANRAIEQAVSLEPGYVLRWGGQFELQQKANARLALVIPVTLALVTLMIYLNFRSFISTALIMLTLPLALVGGVVALWLAGLSVSVPASVGFIALFGIALENALVLVSAINQLRERGCALAEACREAACGRLRPVLMTAVTSGLGLLPLLFATGTGSEVQKPLATVVVGGLVSATLVTLLIVPALYYWFCGVKKG